MNALTPVAQAAPETVPTGSKPTPLKSDAEMAEFIAMQNALHRGFREQHQYTGATDFTSWEVPLPNLTWSRQSTDKIKHWLEQGGFDWEVRDALKKKD